MILELRDLTVGYYNKVVLSNISAKYDAGQLICLTGDNGCGKSTLLRTIAGLQPPLSGDILIDDTSLSTIGSKLSTMVGIVLTNRPDVVNFTVREVVSMGRAQYTGLFGNLSKYDNQIVEASINMVGIPHLAERKISTFSDGEVQKVMIAKCLAQQTPVILMDEPTAFLDFKSKKQLYALMRRLVDEENKLIIFSSHDLPLALEYSTFEQSL